MSEPMAPESERATAIEICRCGHDWEHHVGDHCCGVVIEKHEPSAGQMTGVRERICHCTNWRPKPAPAAAENSPALHETSRGPTNPNEPTLTCSEVVERLATECLRYRYDEGAKLDRFLAIKILTEWRERRVQELEDLLAKRLGCSHCNDSASNSESARTAKETR